MKTRSLIILTMLLSILFSGCKKDDDETLTFTLVSLTAEGIDLAGITAATDVPEDAVITAKFSSMVDATTATNDNFVITLTDDGSSVSYAVSVSDSTVTLTPTNGWDEASQFTIDLSTAIKGENGVAFAGNTLSFRTSGILVPQKDKQVLYLSFDEQAAEDETGIHTVTTVNTLGFVDDRRGVQEAAAYFDGAGNLVEVAAAADLISASITVSFWIKTDLADYDGGDGTGVPQTRFVMGIGAERGYFLEMGRRSKDPGAEGFGEIFLKFASDHVNIGNNGTEVPKATAWTEINSQINVNYDDATQQSGFNFSIDQLKNTNDPLDRDYVREQVMGKWTHLVMTHDATSQTKTIYVNGVKWASFKWVASGKDWLFSDLSLKTKNNDGTNADGVVGKLALGLACSSDNTATGWADHTTMLTATAENKKFYKGAMDQFRIFSVALSDSEVEQLYDNEK